MDQEDRQVWERYRSEDADQDGAGAYVHCLIFNRCQEGQRGGSRVPVPVTRVRYFGFDGENRLLFWRHMQNAEDIPPKTYPKPEQTPRFDPILEQDPTKTAIQSPSQQG